VVEPGPIAEITMTVRYFAAARAAAGAAEESLTVPAVPAVPAGRLSGDAAEPSTAEPSTAAPSTAAPSTAAPSTAAPNTAVPSTATVDAVLEAAIGRHGGALATVLRRCSFLLDEVAVHGTQTRVRTGQILDVLPPFAGG
jgi:molybdopterin converting factor small subunit